MKATQFIKDHGLERAREVVEGAPEHSLFYDLERNKHVSAESTSIAMAFLKNRFQPIEDLKRLVESVDLVNSLGGLQGARKEAHRDCFAFEKNKTLLRAISDYELIYGEGNEQQR